MAKKRYDAKKAFRAIGLHLRSLREAKGWTLEDTEEYGWTSWQQLQKIESGKNITVKTILKLAQLYNVTPASILETI